MSRSLWIVVFSIAVVLSVLLLLSFPYLQPGTESYVLAVASMVLLAVTLAGTAILIRIGWDPASRD